MRTSPTENVGTTTPDPRRGFSLVELVVVILIIGIIAAAAAPKYGSAFSRYRVEAAAKRVVADLELAQRNAKATSTSRTVSFTVASDSYTLAGIGDRNHPSTAYVVNLTQTGYTASLVSADFGGTATVTFDIYGRPDNGGTIVVQSGSLQKTVVLDATTRKANVQ